MGFGRIDGRRIRFRRHSVSAADREPFKTFASWPGCSRSRWSLFAERQRPTLIGKPAKI